ncbi:MAG: efflux RND transporter periplasmic adaptor subunit [Acidobacteriota bacterium]|nr:efflux RND transporter periplasmic adaptor subunit [Acidobacteriota bacterium]
MSESQQTIPTPREQRVADFKVRTLPMIVWFVAAALAIGLLIGRGQDFEYVGLANSLQYEVSASATGTLETVVVDLYDTVHPGDVVAKMDDAPLLAAIDTANGALAQLRAELAARRIEILADRGADHADRSADLRRFQVDEEERRLEILSLRVQIESDEIEVERLRLEAQRARPLLETGLIGQQEFDNFTLLYDSANTQLAENRVLLAQTEEEFRVAQGRRTSFESKMPSFANLDTLLEPLRAAIGVEQARIREIELTREAMLLRSPIDGQVSQILCRSGQAVVPGEPILTIADQSVSEIVAYVREGDSRDIAVNTPVLVASRTRPGALSESVVVRVGESIAPLPQRLWRDQRIPDHGRALVIAASPNMDLMPGELVGVKLLRR